MTLKIKIKSHILLGSKISILRFSWKNLCNGENMIMIKIVIIIRTLIKVEKIMMMIIIMMIITMIIIVIEIAMIKKDETRKESSCDSQNN